MVKNKKVLEGPELSIKEPLGRFEIVKKVVTHFIEFEKDKKGKGTEFRYPVETLSTGEKLYIHRPGIKWNFDFKVELPPNCGLQEGRHDQIALLLRNIKISYASKFNEVWNIIDSLYHGINNDVDSMLNEAHISYNVDNVALDVLLKVIKWLFIMEDIIYWHYEGRAFLYNFFQYAVFEIDKNRLEDTIEKIKQRKIKPEKLKKLLENMKQTWEIPR